MTRRRLVLRCFTLVAILLAIIVAGCGDDPYSPPPANKPDLSSATQPQLGTVADTHVDVPQLPSTQSPQRAVQPPSRVAVQPAPAVAATPQPVQKADEH
jgi:hypothetical protein